MTKPDWFWMAVSAVLSVTLLITSFVLWVREADLALVLSIAALATGLSAHGRTLALKADAERNRNVR